MRGKIVLLLVCLASLSPPALAMENCISGGRKEHVFGFLPLIGGSRTTRQWGLVRSTLIYAPYTEDCSGGTYYGLGYTAFYNGDRWGDGVNFALGTFDGIGAGFRAEYLFDEKETKSIGVFVQLLLLELEVGLFSDRRQILGAYAAAGFMLPIGLYTHRRIGAPPEEPVAK